MKWIPTDQLLPPDETPVLLVLNGAIRIGELRWEIPGYEETFEAFRYWDDPEDDGQGWGWFDVTHWAALPDLPGADEGIESAFFCAANPELVVKKIDFDDWDESPL